MNDTNEAPFASGIDIRFGQMGIVQIRLRTTDAGTILEELQARSASAPRFFERMAVTLDLSALPKDVGIDALRGALDTVRRAGLLPVGLSHGTAGIEALARALELPVMSPFRAQNRAVAAPAAVAAAPQPAVAAERCASPGSAEALALVHHQPVRSGQRIYARQRDLVVTAHVGAGAEVMADGCVHVYGSLRGRAMAGARGATHVRIFCQEFHAELVSIAGIFRVFETLPAELAGKPVQAWLDGDDLRVARIGG